MNRKGREGIAKIAKKNLEENLKDLAQYKLLKLFFAIFAELLAFAVKCSSRRSLRSRR